ncbi:hypothetical protein XENOCAPTIV_023239 [Xenoophorus captivus]|uniref:Uncharacterized protein n=1 Tax=Xenoophorus captivus TaxID=1517983 RepID=A0ABV0S8E8_9TELE
MSVCQGCKQKWDGQICSIQYVLSPQELQSLVETVSCIAKHQCVSERTVKWRMHQCGLSIMHNYSTLTVEQPIQCGEVSEGQDPTCRMQNVGRNPAGCGSLCPVEQGVFIQPRQHGRALGGKTFI